MKSSVALLSAAVSALCVTGCFREAAYSGLPPGKPSTEVDERWHHSMFWGLLDISGSYDLVEACPEGWAEVHTGLDLSNGVLALMTAGIYYPETVTVVCAAPDDRLIRITRPE